MTRLLAWSFGATMGLAVGFLVGESFRDGLALARLGRPEPREGAGTGPSATGPVSGPQIGAQPIPAQRDDEPCTHTLGPLTCPFKGPHTAHAYQSGTWAPDAKNDADQEVR